VQVIQAIGLYFAVTDREINKKVQRLLIRLKRQHLTNKAAEKTDEWDAQDDRTDNGSEGQIGKVNGQRKQGTVRPGQQF
jgi:hypothetical protein